MYSKVYLRYNHADAAQSVMKLVTPGNPLESFLYAEDEADEREDADAFERYRREKPLSEFEYKHQQYTSPVDYWRPQLTEPRRRALAEMAIDFLSIPPTSCDVERAFSAGRRTINDYQHRTKHDLLDAKVCVGNWASPAAPFHGTIDETIKRATEVMTSTMKGKSKIIPAKRTIIEVEESEGGDAQDEEGGNP